MKLSWKIILSMFFVTAFSLSMLSILMYYKYHSNIEGVIRNRFAVTLLDIQNTIESGLKLGTSIAEMSNIQGIIKDVKKNDPEIISIKVFEVKKNKTLCLYNTRTAGIGDNIPNQWKRVLFNTKSPIWKIPERDVTTIGKNIKDTVGNIIGGIAIRYSNEHVVQNEKIIFNSIFFRLIIALIVSLAFIGILVFVFFGRSINTLAYMASLISNTNKPQKFNNKKLDQSLSEDFKNTVNQIRNELSTLETIENSIDKLETIKVTK